mgnify:CR=1 FL=1
MPEKLTAFKVSSCNAVAVSEFKDDFFSEVSAVFFNVPAENVLSCTFFSVFVFFAEDFVFDFFAFMIAIADVLWYCVLLTKEVAEE